MFYCVNALSPLLNFANIFLTYLTHFITFYHSRHFYAFLLIVLRLIVFIFTHKIRCLSCNRYHCYRISLYFTMEVRHSYSCQKCKIKCKWNKTDMNQELKHVNLTLSFWAPWTIAYGQVLVRARSILALQLWNFIHRNIM